MKSLFIILVAAVCVFGVRFSAEASEQVFTRKFGDFEVSLLSDGQNEGETSLFVNADEAVVKKYAPKGTYAGAVNAFLLRTPEETVLVDTGFGKLLFDNMKALGVSPEQIDAVLITHLHIDHISGLVRDGKTAFPKAKLYVAKEDREYWTDISIMNKQPENRRGGFKLAQDVLKSYDSRVIDFSPSPLGKDAPDILPGIKAYAAFGHTPGHTAFMVESRGEKLMIWGDLTHAMAVQMPVPSVAMVYDSDPKAAIATRIAVLKYVAENDISVAGMHIPFPAMGKVSKANEGFVFTPLK